MKGAMLGSSPIRPDAPTGEDVRDQEVFVDLQSEVNRSQSVSSGASAVVDWKKVRETSERILETRSKDLLVASYLCVALARTEGPPGVMEGLAIMNAMVKDHWEGLFPPIGRLRARRNALSWWMDQMQEILPSLSDPPLSLEESEACAKELRDLNGTLGDKDPDAPSLAPLYVHVDGLPVSLPESEAESSSGSETSSSGKETTTGGGFLISEEGDPTEVLDQISPALLRLSDRLSEADAGNSRSIFLSRMILWEGIREIPESENGMTRIPAPPSHLLLALETLTTSDSEEDLLRFLLSRQAEVPFWFDLSVKAGRILEGRGPGGAGGAEAIRGTLRALFARLPGIERLSFAGGEEAFLSEEGRSWLSPGEPSQNEGEEGPRGTNSVLASVRSSFSEGRILEACDRFEEIRRKEASPRGRFLLNLELLTLVERMGRDFPVLSLALVLLEDLERIRLDLWEPTLAARALPVLCRVLSSSGDESLRRRAEDFSGRLAAFDVSGAVRSFQSGR